MSPIKWNWSAELLEKIKATLVSFAKRPINETIDLFTKRLQSNLINKSQNLPFIEPFNKALEL